MTAQDAHSGRTVPAEGDRTPESSTAKSGPFENLADWEREFLQRQAVTDAAIEAATKALNREADESGSWAIGRLNAERDYRGLFGVNGDARDLSEIAVRAAAPILRQAIAEEIARAIGDLRMTLDYGELADTALDRAAAIAREIGARNDR